MISTHVLDISKGKPAAGIEVILDEFDGSDWRPISRGVTDADGRIASLCSDIGTGNCRLRFQTAAYLGPDYFYPEVIVPVRLQAGLKYHLPLLLSPFGYSTYRGS